MSFLQVTLGQASLTGRRGGNEDFLGAVTPEGEVLRDKGVAVAVADGVGKGRGGRAAAEISVRRFLSDYYSSPDTWGLRKCLEQTLADLNRNVRESAAKEGKGGAATFASLVMRGRWAFIAHAGDARVYLLRQGVMRKLTEDHVWDHPDLRNVVSRAVGLDEHFHPELRQETLQEGDVFLLCTDGLYKAREPAAEALREALRDDLQAGAEALASAAIQAGSDDDVSLILLRVDRLPSEDGGNLSQDAIELPLLAEAREGMTVDEFYLTRRLHRGQLSEVYLAEDLRRRRQVALKFPRHSAATPEDAKIQIDRFLREEWVGRRVQNRHVLPALALEPGRRTCLYYATPWHTGETLRRRLDSGGSLPASDAVEWIIQVAKGMEALHRLQVLHRDIKPDNILIDEEGKAILLDLGVAHAEGFAADSQGENATPGTPSYMAPELFRGAAADERTEVYSLGATLYELLTRKLPYGEIEPFTQPRFQRWTPPSRYNPQIPLWLETVIQKATDADPARRFQALSEMRFYLERRERVGLDEGKAKRAGQSSGDAALLRWKLATVIFALVALLEFLLRMRS